MIFSCNLRDRLVKIKKLHVLQSLTLPGKFPFNNYYLWYIDIVLVYTIQNKTGEKRERTVQKVTICDDFYFLQYSLKNRHDCFKTRSVYVYTSIWM